MAYLPSVANRRMLIYSGCLFVCSAVLDFSLDVTDGLFDFVPDPRVKKWLQSIGLIVRPPLCCRVRCQYAFMPAVVPTCCVRYHAVLWLVAVLAGV